MSGAKPAKPAGNPYYEAVGELAANAADAEHFLHYAVLWCFPEGQRWMVHELVKDAPATRLLDWYELFYPDRQDGGALLQDLRQSFEQRNTILHGSHAMIYEGGELVSRLTSRKKKARAPPTAAQIGEAALKLRALISEIMESINDRPEGYVPVRPKDRGHPMELR